MSGSSARAKGSKPGGGPQTRQRKLALAVSGIARSSKAEQASIKSDKYIHVHHYLDTGRWGAWFKCSPCKMQTAVALVRIKSDKNDPRIEKGCRKRRLYFGTYDTEFMAARAQDRAALKFKPFSVKLNTPLNFTESDYELDKELRDELEPHQFRRMLMGESRKCYKTNAPSPCFWKFMEEERTKIKRKINLRTDSEGHHPMQPRTATEIIIEIRSSAKPVVKTVAATRAKGKVNRAGENEGQVGHAKRTRRLSQIAPPVQPAGSPADTLATKQGMNLQARRFSQPCSRVVAPVRGTLPSQSRLSSRMIPVTLKRLAWERTSTRSTREKLRETHEAARDVASKEPDPWNMLMLACAISEDSDGAPTLADDEDTDNEPAVLYPNKRGRLYIQLNSASEDPSTADLVEPAIEAGVGSEEIGVHALVTMMKLL